MLVIYAKEGFMKDRWIIFPGKTVSKEYFESLMEKYKSLGYRVSFEEKNDRYILKVTKNFIIIGYK